MSDDATRRSEWMWGLCSISLVLCTFGCQSPKSKANLDRASDGAVKERDGGVPGAKIVLPGGFEPSIDCGGLGKSCSVDSKCVTKLSCAGANCLPEVDGKQVVSCVDASCPEDAPICTLGTCLTVDQLACVCARPEAQNAYIQCQSLLASGRPACFREDSLCDASPDDCCEGLSCLRGKDASGKQMLGLCKVACKDEGDCKSGECCASAQGIAGKFCGPRNLCVRACGELRAECDENFRPCCDDLVCAKSSQDPVLDGCQEGCAKDSECESGCCVLFTNRDHGVCAPKDRCPMM